jgi:hypothetical protein
MKKLQLGYKWKSQLTIKTYDVDMVLDIIGLG